MFCTSPITIYRRGMRPTMNPATGLPAWPVVACGWCPTCIAGRKNDWAGRLVAEAKAAKDVYFVTLTYKDEPEVFRYADVQEMLKRLRSDLERKYAGTKLRFFCVGERGNKFGRIHWHLLFFMDKRVGWGAWNKQTQTGKLWHWWPHGWADIAKVPAGDTVRRVRYCAKYAVKTLGQEHKSCRFRCSLKPAIGAAFLTEWVDTLVLAGLPLKGFFTIPGITFDRGRRRGELQRFRLKGASARMVARLYAEGWERERRLKVWPVTPFFQRYFPEEITTRRLLWPESYKPFDWTPDADLRPDFRAVNRLEESVKQDAVRFTDEWQKEEDARQAEASERWIELCLAAASYEERRRPEREREWKERDLLAVGADCRSAAALRWLGGACESVWANCEGASGVREAQRFGFDNWVDLRGRKFLQDPRSAERVAAERRVGDAIRARGFEAVEFVDPETGEVGVREGAPLSRRREPDRREPSEPIGWKPVAGGNIERSYPFEAVAAWGKRERRKGKA